ncbi:hypothetical protein ACQ4PT_002218 [Festuca glaucescens]
MELLDGMRKVEQMVELYEEKKCITLTVIKGGSTLPSNINTTAVEEQIPISEIGKPVVYIVGDDGVVLPSQECTELTEDSDMLYLCTQQSNNMNKGKRILDAEEETAFAEEIQGCSEDMEEDGDYMEEDEVDSGSDEECELNQRLIDLKKRKRGSSLPFCEDEVEAEDIFCDSGWIVEKIRESVSSFGRLLVWHRDNSNRARIIVKIRVSNILDIPISHVLEENTNDDGHGHSWTCVVYILDARLIGGLGADEDPIQDGTNPHPLPNIAFGGIWDDQEQEQNFDEHHDEMDINGNAAPQEPHVAPAADPEPMVSTPPLHMGDHTTIAQDLAASMATDTLNPMIEAVDSYAAMNKLVTDMLQPAPAMLNRINPSQINGARITTFDVVDVASAERKCLLTVYASEPAPAPVSTVKITEIVEDTPMIQPLINQEIHLPEHNNTFDQDQQEDSYLSDSRDYQYIDDHEASDLAMDNLNNDQADDS